MCGIFGQLSTRVRPFNSTYFRMAGILNDARGGDSCGIMINRAVEYGVDATKLFRDFKETSDLVFYTEDCDVALGHTRKASVGKVDIASAQPVCIYNDNGLIDFVLIHNGTIKNYKELNEKYKTNCPAHYTDSMVMAEIMYHHGYDVLGEYHGAAAMVIVDYRGGKPEIMLFKGKSKQTSYAKDAEEERPLFYCKSGGSLYFSSLSNVLDGFFIEETYTLKANNLVRLKEADDDEDVLKLILVKSFDRESLVEPNPFYSGSRASTGYDCGDYSGYSGYRGGNSGYRGNDVVEEKIKEVKTDFVGNGKVFFDGEGYVEKSGNKVSFVHGHKNISSFGYSLVTGLTNRDYYFWNGVLLKSKDCFNALETLYHMKLKEEPGFTLGELIVEFDELVGILSYHEILPFASKNGGIDYWKYDIYSEMIASHKYTGAFQPLFDSNLVTYQMDNGEIVSRTTDKAKQSTNAQLDILNGYAKSFNKEIVYNIINIAK